MRNTFTTLLKTRCSSQKWVFWICRGSKFSTINCWPVLISSFGNPDCIFSSRLHLQKWIVFGINCVALGYVQHLLRQFGNRKVNFEPCEYPLTAQTLNQSFGSPLSFAWCREIGNWVNLDHSGIVRSTKPTLMVQPVKPWSSLLITVIAQYILTAVPVFFRELLRSQQGIKHAKVHRHVSQRFATNWTNVVSASVSLKACRMHKMTTR